MTHFECRCPKCGKKLAEIGRLPARSSLYKRCPNCGHTAQWLIRQSLEEAILKSLNCPHCRKILGERYGYPVWIKCPRCKNICVF